MIVIGASSDISQAFVQVLLKEGHKFPIIYLLSSSLSEAEKIAQHLRVRYEQECEVIALNLEQEIDYTSLDQLSCELLFVAAGFLGTRNEDGWYDPAEAEKIIAVNFAALVPLVSFFAQKMAVNGTGTIIGLSSVAGERGRQSNYLYGAAKAGFTAYLDGLRNLLFSKGVHVMTVIPGFMKTKMTANIETPKLLTISPQQAATQIYKGFKAKRNRIFISALWWPIMKIVKSIPESIFKKMKM